MPEVIPMIGKRFGRLTVIAEGGRASNGGVSWVCQCDCGQVTKPILGSYLRGNTKKSCGCLRREIAVERGKSTRKHGMHNTRLYYIWGNMKSRCYNPNNSHFASYGLRGITVCAEWLNSFEAFHEWAMANGYADNLTIDRIDNNGNYCPENCRWATIEDQNRNKRNSIHIEINGKTQTLSQWSKESGVPKSTMIYRYNHGKTGADLIRKAVTTNGSSVSC